jgi:hypothetical protein
MDFRRFGVLAITLLAPVAVFAIDLPALVNGKPVGLVAAVTSEARGQRIAITVFGNTNWQQEIPAFDPNSAVLQAAKTHANRDLHLALARADGILIPPLHPGLFGWTMPGHEVADQLTRLAASWNTEVVLILIDDNSYDWIGGTNQRIIGYGHYSRHFNVAFGCFRLLIFDCKSARFFDGGPIHESHGLTADWHEKWDLYPSAEQKTFLHAWGEIADEAAIALLSATGLTAEKAPDTSRRPALREANDQAPAIEGIKVADNTITFPGRLPRAQALDCVIRAFAAREWTTERPADDRIVGSYIKGKRKAVCTASLSAGCLVLAPEGFEFDAAGKPVRVEVYQRWQKNLVESIVSELTAAASSLPAEGDTKAPETHPPTH